MNTLLANHKEHFKVLLIRRRTRHLERMPVTLSAAKGLARRTQSSFAALRMTARAPLKPAHGKPSLQMSNFAWDDLTPRALKCYSIKKYEEYTPPSTNSNMRARSYPGGRPGIRYSVCWAFF